MACDRQRFGRPRWLKFGRERVFVLKASQTLKQRSFRSGSHCQKGDLIAARSRVGSNTYPEAAAIASILVAGQNAAGYLFCHGT